MSETANPSSNEPSRSRIPLWVKLLYTGFVAVMVPYLLHCYGPTNFLYYCDVAVLMTLVAVWREDPLWASMPAVGILLPQTFWIVDFLARAVGLPMTGMTAYMFSPTIPLFTRASRYSTFGCRSFCFGSCGGSAMTGGLFRPGRFWHGD